MNLSVRDMIDGTVVRLRYVFRYSTSRVQHPESVAEHSYFVGLFCLFISRWVSEETDHPVNLSNLMQRALLHDLEEARSGDFPRPFKHSSKELKDMLETASLQAFEQVIIPVVGNDNVARDYKRCWLTAKDVTLEGRILEFADFLSVLSFMMQESAGNGNRSIERHVADMDLYFEVFKGEQYDFIRPLIEQAEVLMEEVFP